MLSVIDVIKSLTILMQENFPNYLVNDRDLEEGFERPSFFIDIAEVRGSTKTARYVTEYAELELFMFEKNIYQGFLNLLDAKNKILVLLQQPLKLTDDNNKVVAHIVFNDVEVNISKADKALSCTMNYELVQEVEIPEPEYTIEHVEIDVDIN